MDKFKAYFNSVNQLINMYLKPGELPVVALAGPYNTGKSTMLNSLLDRQVSPVDIVPTTSVPLLISHGELFTIRARLLGGRIKVLTGTELVLQSTGKLPLAPEVQTVEITFNHELLQRMHLVDTPGIDAAGATDELPEAMMQADHIAYMLHQRGPGETDRKVIGRLVKSSGPARISFWINRNLGSYDGTSLQEARRVLREICEREIEVHVTDTRNREAVRTFRLFIEDRAAELVIRKITRRLKEMDNKIPSLIGNSLRQHNDASFLIGFGEARLTADRVLRGRHIMNDLPPVSQRIRSFVEQLNRPEDRLPPDGPSHRDTEPGPDPALVRDRIKSLLTRAAADPILHEQPQTAALLELADELDREQYLVTTAGGFSTGKTTFLNALLGEALLPAENRPTTFAITRLMHGAEKKAIIRFARQVTIPTHHVENNYATICRHELEVLERWLKDHKLRPRLSCLEKKQNSRSIQITYQELLQEIEALKETFARGRQRFKGQRRPWKSLFKRIPLHKYTGGGRPDYFTVYFQRRENMEIDLDDEKGRSTLRKIAGSYRALWVDEIEIRHPAEILRTATFVDTPGLDSVYHRHREITTRYLPRSDCFLFFLNGKHILTKPDLGTYAMITRAMNDAVGTAEKLFLIINFADALNDREKERVRNYLHTNLVRHSQGTLKPAGVYMVSALGALTGKDARAFYHLNSDLKKRIWSSRCADNYAGVTRRAGDLLRNLIEVSPPSPPAHLQRHEQRDEVEQLLHQTAQTIKIWKKRIEKLDSAADFRGLRDGKRSVKKGFLGLARKTVPQPSCRDLSAEINAVLARFQARWSPGNQPGIDGLNITALENILDRILDSKNINSEQARHKLRTLLDSEETRIRKSVQELENGQKTFTQSGSEAEHIAPPAPLISAVDKYIREFETLEKEITTPGGMAHGKRQGAG